MFKEGFRHAFVAIRYDDVFFVLEDSFQGFYPNLLLKEDFFYFTKLNNCHILIMEGNKPCPKKFGIWYWAPTCVNFCKTVGSLRTKAQTPWQLYKYLLKKGAQKWVDTQDKLQDSKLQKKQKPLQQNNNGNLKKNKRQLKPKQKKLHKNNLVNLEINNNEVSNLWWKRLKLVLWDRRLL